MPAPSLISRSRDRHVPDARSSVEKLEETATVVVLVTGVALRAGVRRAALMTHRLRHAARAVVDLMPHRIAA